MIKRKNLVVGAGLSGAVIARKIAEELNEEVLVIDKKDHIAGNCYDYVDKNGICVHKYGSHIFHTNFYDVWQFTNQYCSFNKYNHEVLGNVDNKEIPIPFNLNSLHAVFDKKLADELENKLLAKFKIDAKIPIQDFVSDNDSDLRQLADFIYKKVFLNYTKKQWGMEPDDLDKSVISRVPVYISRDNRYFQDKHQGIPIGGYTRLIKNILNHENVEIKLNTEFQTVKNENNFDRVFYTGSIDEFFEYEYGLLPYRSVYFELEEHDAEFYQSNSVINYPNTNNYTRIHEYKYYLNDKSNKTVIAKEFSQEFKLGQNERIYPIPRQDNEELYQKYLEKASHLKNVYFLGRLGDYKYYNMDLAIKRALDLFTKIESERNDVIYTKNKNTTCIS